MCSQISRQLAEHQGTLLAAVTEVAENSLFAFADVSFEDVFEETASAAGADWLHARIQFAGPVDGWFELTTPGALARRLCAAFSGAASAEDVSEDDVTDFTGELANMLCGAWLTRSSREEAFDLAPPQVRRGRPQGVTRTGGLDAGTFYLAIDDTPIRLRISWGGADPSGAGPC